MKWFKYQNTKIYIFLTLILISVISVWPIFKMGHLDYGYDTTFHYARLQGLSNYFSSPVNFQNFGNQGKMVNIFYPPITLLPVQIFYYITHDFVNMYKFAWLYVALINVFGAYLIGYYYKKNYFIALIFSVLWTFAVSKINKEIGSGAISNVLAYGFFPFVLYGLQQILNKEENKGCDFSRLV